MNHWLIKTEPGSYSWYDFVKEKITNWDGVRNFQAINNLKAMRKGDLAFLYHSGSCREIMGIAKVVKEHFTDPTDEVEVAVAVKAEKKLHQAVTLKEVKANKKLADMVLVKNSRLSVQPVKQQEFEIILAMSEQK